MGRRDHAVGHLDAPAFHEIHGELLDALEGSGVALAVEAHRAGGIHDEARVPEGEIGLSGEQGIVGDAAGVGHDEGGDRVVRRQVAEPAVELVGAVAPEVHAPGRAIPLRHRSKAQARLPLAVHPLAQLALVRRPRATGVCHGDGVAAGGQRGRQRCP